MGLKKDVKKIGGGIKKAGKDVGKAAKKAGKAVVGPVAPSQKEFEKHSRNGG